MQSVQYPVKRTQALKTEPQKCKYDKFPWKVHTQK